jgi:hypothetical protein
VHWVAFAEQTHTPLLHSVPGMQTVPHLPQFFESLFRSAQVLVPHSVRPVAHTQLAAVHMRVASHGLLHCPQ